MVQPSIAQQQQQQQQQSQSLINHHIHDHTNILPAVQNVVNHHVSVNHHPVIDSVLPPPLEPTEEALVASIVADLPNDADFSDVLNKIPDDAFNDFFVDHQNGEGPSTEETEALEQALAMVNKDVQNLVAGISINGNADINGQSGALQEIFGLASNWLGSLTSEQRQQLNGLIDGAIASSSLSPILKSACETFPSTFPSSSTSTQTSAPTSHQEF